MKTLRKNKCAHKVGGHHTLTLEVRRPGYSTPSAPSTVFVSIFSLETIRFRRVLKVCRRTEDTFLPFLSEKYSVPKTTPAFSIFVRCYNAVTHFLPTWGFCANADRNADKGTHTFHSVECFGRVFPSKSRGFLYYCPVNNYLSHLTAREATFRQRDVHL